MNKTNKENTYGYVRVSTKEQHEDSQVSAMKEFGVPEQNIVIEKMSGKDFNRAEYKNLINKLKSGDTVVIKSIDRLGRNYSEIIEQWRLITKVIEADIVVIDMPLLDTRRREQDLTSMFVADIVLQILSYVAQTERMFNKKRQAEGIVAAMAKGTKFGRRAKEKPKAFYTVHKMWQKGEISAREAARRLGVSHPTFLTWVKDGEQEK